MKSFCKCKSLMLTLIIGIMTLMPVSQAYCQSMPEPAVVISIAKFKEQLKDVDYILKASGFANFKFMAKAMINGYTKGIDGGQDAGVLLYFNDESETPDFLGFAAVSDMDEMLDVVSTAAQVEEDDDYITIVPDNGPQIYVKESNGNAFFSNKKESLTNLPDTPATMLEGLPSKYNLAAQIYGQRIPESLRDKILTTIKESSEQTFQNFDENLQTEIQRKNLEMQMAQMEMLFEETDKITLGMSIDGDAERMLMDIEFTGLPGSELAKTFTASKANEPSRFTGFLMDGATFTQNQCVRLAKTEADRYSELLDDLKKGILSEIEEEDEMSDEERTTVENALTNCVDVLKATMAEGLIDSGAVLMLKEGEANFAAGIHVADPQKLEATVKDLAVIAEEKMGGEIEVNLNSGSHKSVTFHQFVVQIPDEEEEMRDVLGDQLELVVGVGKKEIYVAGGSNPMVTLKSAMDGTEMAQDMLQYNFYVTPILEFAASMEGDQTVEAMAKALKESGKDRISMTSNLIENGVQMRFEMQDGILGLIKVGYDAMQGGFDQDDF